MTANYVHTLTETELACGVTLDAVARELTRGVFRENGTRFIVDPQLPPALALSVARAAFAGRADYVGKTALGRSYRAA